MSSGDVHQTKFAVLDPIASQASSPNPDTSLAKCYKFHQSLTYSHMPQSLQMLLIQDIYYMCDPFGL